MIGSWFCTLWPGELVAYAFTGKSAETVSAADREQLRQLGGIETGAVLGAGVWLTLARSRLPARSGRDPLGFQPWRQDEEYSRVVRSASPSEGDLWDDQIDGPRWTRPHGGVG